MINTIGGETMLNDKLTDSEMRLIGQALKTYNSDIPKTANELGISQAKLRAFVKFNPKLHKVIEKTKNKASGKANHSKRDLILKKLKESKKVVNQLYTEYNGNLTRICKELNINTAIGVDVLRGLGYTAKGSRWSESELETFRQALYDANWVMARAAKKLGISANTLASRIRIYIPDLYEEFQKTKLGQKTQRKRPPKKIAITIPDITKAEIVRALDFYEYNVKSVASYLGLKMEYLDSLIKKYKIKIKTINKSKFEVTFKTIIEATDPAAAIDKLRRSNPRKHEGFWTKFTAKKIHK